MKREKAKNEKHQNKMMKLKSIGVCASCKEIFKLFYTMDYHYSITYTILPF